LAKHIGRARAAALREDPIPGRLANWWRGTLVETAYRHMHAAQVGLIDLYEQPELHAEARQAVARAHATLHKEDPRQTTVEDLCGRSADELRPLLRRLTADSFGVIDGQHAQLRSFRNIVLLAALFTLLLTVTTVAIGIWNPAAIPLCFDASGSCPSGDRANPSSWDAPVVALLGALGGALAATVSIRNLKGTSIPYDVPVALSWLKVPLGAFTAILAVVAIRGGFVPGLSTLDSQEQILAYALVFGFAQQVFTRLLDQRAQTLLHALPSKDGQDAAVLQVPAAAAHRPNLTAGQP
jgi:hypothetical protein